MLLICLVFLSLFYLYLYLTKNQDYWAKRNVKFDTPLPFFGNHLRSVLVRRTVTDIGIELYNKYPNDKIVGYFRGRTPELIIRDLDIAKHILIADFRHFHSRGGFESYKEDVVGQNLIFMAGGRWSILRHRITAAFTNAKLKAMFPLLSKCTKKLESTLKDETAKTDTIDAYPLMAQYSMECITSCGFGVELNTTNANHSDFLEEAMLFFNQTKLKAFHVALEDICPDWKALHGVKVIKNSLSHALIELTRKVRDERGGSQSGRNDLMDILLDIESKGKITIDSPYDTKPDGTPEEVSLELDINNIAAQVAGIIFAGFETTATVASYTLHQLAFNTEIQEKLQSEIDNTLSKHGELSNEALGEMSLLKMAVKESLRMLPPIGMLRRVCNKRYTIPGTGVSIDPGVRILVPIQAIHMDPQYFNDPAEYRPERFASEIKTANYAFMPFGNGPRACLGSRLGYLQTMAGLAAVLHNFSVSPATASRRHHTVKKSSYLVQIVEGGIPLEFTARI